MRDVVNPFLLLVVVVLIACRTAFDGTVAGQCDLWALVVCGTAFVVNLALGLARAFTRRQASLLKTVWAIVFLLLGSAVLVMPGNSGSADDPEEVEMRAMLAEYRKNPASFTGEKMGGLVLTAASTGRVQLLRELLKTSGVEADAELLPLALQAAAENGHLPVVELLQPQVRLNQPVQGCTPLVAAASAGKVKVVEALLAAGADPNLADSAGTPPVIHAVLADSAPCVRLLLQKGADATRCDADGRNAASYSRNGEIDALLGTE